MSSGDARGTVLRVDRGVTRVEPDRPFHGQDYYFLHVEEAVYVDWLPVLSPVGDHDV